MLNISITPCTKLIMANNNNLVCITYCIYMQTKGWSSISIQLTSNQWILHEKTIPWTTVVGHYHCMHWVVYHSMLCCCLGHFGEHHCLCYSRVTPRHCMTTITGQCWSHWSDLQFQWRKLHQILAPNAHQIWLLVQCFHELE